ncbi:MAG TPA: hypothetical protein VF085_00725 [Solirubrobacterales bacterium]
MDRGGPSAARRSTTWGGPLAAALTPLACLLGFFLVPADAAGYVAYVGCSDKPGTAPAHVCNIGDSPGAFFETPVGATYDVCVEFPTGRRLCSPDQRATADVLYVNKITSNIEGEHRVSWFVEGTEVGSWTFRMRRPGGPAQRSTTKLACADPNDYEGFLFLSHPRTCVEYRGNMRYHVYELGMSKLHWRSWGGARALGRGRWRYCGTGTCVDGPVETVASRRVFACGRFAYTRLRVHIVVRHRHDSTYRLHLPAC